MREILIKFLKENFGYEEELLITELNNKIRPLILAAYDDGYEDGFRNGLEQAQDE